MKSSDSKPLPVYVVFGVEEFLCRQALKAVLSEVFGPQGDASVVTTFDGEDAELADVLDACRTATLLAPVSVACVWQADDFVSRHREALEKYLDAPCSTGHLILVCRSWSARTRLARCVERIGRAIACESPKPAALASWVTQQALKGHDCRLDPAAARRLIELVGGQLGLLDMELGKLATYVGERKTIGAQDVDDLVGATRLETVFRITDAIARRDAATAMELWDQVIATDRDAEYRAIGGLAYGFRRLAEAKRLAEQGLPLAECAKRLNIWAEPTSLKRQLDRFSLAQWQDHLRTLLGIDLRSKTGLGAVRSGVEGLIVQWCRA